jgi:hypothetical protein
MDHIALRRRYWLHRYLRDDGVHRETVVKKGGQRATTPPQPHKKKEDLLYLPPLLAFFALRHTESFNGYSSHSSFGNCCQPL